MGFSSLKLIICCYVHWIVIFLALPLTPSGPPQLCFQPLLSDSENGLVFISKVGIVKRDLFYFTTVYYM